MTTAPSSVRVSRIIRAHATTLFRAWTEPRLLMQWWRQEGDGWSFAGASVDLRVGGQYRLAMTDPEGNTHAAVGVYRELAPPVRLAFTWDWENPATSIGETLVTVEFNHAGEELTEVIVTHERFADVRRLRRHEQGWTELLRLLERCIGSRARLHTGEEGR